MTQEHPVVARYMTQFERCTREFDFPGRGEIANEIRNHIAEASAAGKPLDAILQSLGPADALARAYAVELLLERRSSRRARALTRFVRLASVVAAGSVVSLLVVGLLGSAGLGFTASGVVILTIGGLEEVGIHLPGVQMNGVPPALAMALGVLVLALGAVSLIGLRLYVRFVIRTLKTVGRVSRPISNFA